MNTTPQQLYATGRLDEAQAACRQRLATNPTEHGAMHLLGINEAERWSESEPVLRSVLSEIPDHPLALLNLGNSLHSQGRSQDAVALYR
jgi:tetratricopeptide (TPR) repeat protein